MDCSKSITCSLQLISQLRQNLSTFSRFIAGSDTFLSMCYVHTCQDCIRIGKFSFLIYDGMRS